MGEVKIIWGGMTDLLLLPSGAIGSSGFNVDGVTIFIVLRGVRSSW